MKFKYIPPTKLKVLIVMFFVGAGVGIMLGLIHHHMYLTLLGVVNLILGGVMGGIYYFKHQECAMIEKSIKNNSSNCSHIGLFFKMKFLIRRKIEKNLKC